MSANRIFQSCAAALLMTVAVAGAHGASNLTHVFSSNATPPTVGLEGQMEVLLPEPGLTAQVPDRRAPLLLRIASTRPHGTLTYYDLRYIGRVPGQYDLRHFLVATNGQPAAGLSPLAVSVLGVLPEPHNGWLVEQSLRAPSFFGRYRTLMFSLIALWLAALFLILGLSRKPKAAVANQTVPRSLSFAERLRPLVERAAAGELTPDEQAALERMLIAHWQRRLKLETADGNELMSQLRQHPEAGALLRTLEDWLHRPPGSATIDLEAALAPYRRLPDEPSVEAEVAR